MAIKPPAPQPTVKHYIAALPERLTTYILIGSIFTGCLIAFLLVITGLIVDNIVLLLVISGAAAALSAATATGIALALALPFTHLLTAIAYKSGERLTGKIPNPHDQKYEQNGLGTAIQAVYDLDSTSSTVDNTEQNDPAPITSSLNRMHGGVIALDAARHVAYASRSAPTYTVNGVLRPQLLFHDSDSLDLWLDECAEKSVRAEHQWLRIPNQPSDKENQRIFDVYASYEKGAVHETVLTLIDMTERYAVDEEDLNFIAFAAHELRGPITVIRGYLDVLQEELGDVIADDQRELFRRLSVSASRLASYVNNILNTSSYDRRHLSVTLLPEDVATIYSSIADDMALRASAQQRLLSVAIPDNLPQIAADRGSLSEVIGNLIDNAIKYSNEGGTVSVTAATRGDVVDIIIEDHGIGMSGNVVKNLFQKFYRSHRSRETVAGSGIGLYISKAIVESHGGTISVRSTEGKGSTFIISIPTYASVADKLAERGDNHDLISEGKGWIKNHAMYRG